MRLAQLMLVNSVLIPLLLGSADASDINIPVVPNLPVLANAPAGSSKQANRLKDRLERALQREVLQRIRQSRGISGVALVWRRPPDPAHREHPYGCEGPFHAYAWQTSARRVRFPTSWMTSEHWS